jgi:hypothetical protein
MAEQPAQQPMAPAAKPKMEGHKGRNYPVLAGTSSRRADPDDAGRYDHQGTTYAEDGVRITGSREFIASVLPRLKEFLNFESPTTKLALVYRETDSPSKSSTDNKTSFVFYIQAKERGQAGSGTPETPTLPKPKVVKPPKVGGV